MIMNVENRICMMHNPNNPNNPNNLKDSFFSFETRPRTTLSLVDGLIVRHITNGTLPF